MKKISVVYFLFFIFHDDDASCKLHMQVHRCQLITELRIKLYGAESPADPGYPSIEIAQISANTQ